MRFLRALADLGHTGHATRTPQTISGGLVLVMLLGVFATIGGQHSPPRPEFSVLILYPLVVFVLSWLALKTIKSGFRFEKRYFPKTCLEGERLIVEVSFFYDSSIQFPFILARDTFMASEIFEGPETALYYGQMLPGKRFTFQYAVEAGRGYGEFPVGPLKLRVFDPLRLFSDEIEIGGTDLLRVELNPPAPDNLDLSKDNALTPIGDSRSTRTGPSLEFFGIKEYSYGDDIRSVCWAKMAQLGKPVIKTFELDCRPEVLLVVNTDVTKVKGFGSGNTLKRALRTTAGIIGECQSKGLTVRLVLPVREEPRLFTILPSIQGRIFANDLLASIDGSRIIDLPTLLVMAHNQAGPATVMIVVSHTLDLPLEPVISALLSIRAKQAKVAFWAMDDADMVRFSTDFQAEKIDRRQFVERMEELGVEIRLMPARSAPPPEIANSRREAEA